MNCGPKLFPTFVWQVKVEMVKLPEVMVQGNSLIHMFHCPHSIQLWNSFMSCDIITKGLGLKSYEVCKISYVSPMKAYKRPMHGCIG